MVCTLMRRHIARFLVRSSSRSAKVIQNCKRRDPPSGVARDALHAHAHHRVPFHAHDRAHDPARARALSRVRNDDASAGRDAPGQIHYRVAPPISLVHAQVLEDVFVGTSPCLSWPLAGCKHLSTDRHMAAALDAMGQRRSPNPCRTRRALHKGSSQRKHPRLGRAREPARQVRSVRASHAACPR